jgi:polyhydroxybutyrate depolymerase
VQDSALGLEQGVLAINSVPVQPNRSFAPRLEILCQFVHNTPIIAAPFSSPFLPKNMTKPTTSSVYLMALCFMLPWAGTILVAEDPQVGQFIEFMHKNVKRKYLLHVPQELPDNSPLVFVLHGYHGDARDYVDPVMNRLADDNGFAVCYPQGTDDREGIPHWNARLKISGVDDVGFLSALASDLQDKHSLNKSRTFVCGISNGGFMSYTLVAEKPDVFKAAASVNGTMSGHTWEYRDAIRPVPILQISGLDDEIVPYNGSMSKDGGWGGAPDQDAMMEFWRKLNKTSSEEVIQLSKQTTAHHYKDGVNGNEVWHYKIKNFGHKVPGRRELGTEVAQVIWQFFSKVSDDAGPQRE